MVLSPGDMFVMPAKLNPHIGRPWNRDSFNVCTIIACKEVAFGTRGRSYSVTLLANGCIYSNKLLSEVELDQAQFLHRAG